MGMFGQLGRGVLNQAGVNLLGVDFQRQAQHRAQLEAIRQAQQKAAGLLRPQPGAMQQAQVGNAEGDDITSAFGPQMEQGPSRQRTPQEIAASLAELTAGTPGFNQKPFLDAAQYAKPSIKYDRGFGYDDATGAKAGEYHPDLEKGAEPLYDRSGRIVAVRNINGSVSSAAEMAAAVEGAKAKAKAPYEFQTVQGPDGRPNVVTSATAAALGANGGLVAKGQTPAEASAAKIQGDARAGAQVALPGGLEGINSAIENVNKLISDPGLKSRTGMLGVLPAIPGTHGVAVDALKKQIGGQIFLDAYASLKGGGQITEVEGKKATQAKARMDSAQTYNDYVSAAKDYMGALQRGRDLMLRQAGGGEASSATQPSAARAAPAPPLASRQAGQTYQTPRGPMKWTGTGWVQ